MGLGANPEAGADDGVDRWGRPGVAQPHGCMTRGDLIGRIGHGLASTWSGSATPMPSAVRVAWAGPRLSAHALQILGERHLPAIHIDWGFQGRGHTSVAGQRRFLVGRSASSV